MLEVPPALRHDEGAAEADRAVDGPVAVLPSGGQGTVEQIVCAYDWSCTDALLVIYGPTPPNRQAPHGCPNGESGGNAGVIGAGSVGLMQVQVFWHVDKVSRVVGRAVNEEEATALLLDPAINVAVGYQIFVAGGRTFSAWSCRP